MFGATKDFIGKPAPPNYVAGLGRGATGFTTRSDIGPAREASDFPVDPKLAQGKPEADENDERYQDPDNEVGLFSGAPYEEDDEEADKVWDMVDERMDERRRKRREEREREEMEQLRQQKPNITNQFSDLKRQLSTIDDAEWAAIPEVGDLVGKNRKRSKVPERFTPLPDSILASSRDQTQYDTTLDQRQQQLGGFATPDGAGTDFRAIGQARDKVLGLKLDRASADSASGQTTVDPKGYLTDLGSVTVKSAAEIGDIKKARLLLNSVITTNPKHAPGWIAAARLEETAGKPVQARSMIAKGCEMCPDSDDVWLEAARLNTTENAKVVIAEAVRHIPQSIKIWLRAIELETAVASKKKVLRRALEYIPRSEQLWKQAVNLEDDQENAKVLLVRAVELIPTSINLWIALARLETYEKAQKVLNKARTENPTSHEIWISALRLTEQHALSKSDKTLKISVLSRLQEGHDDENTDMEDNNFAELTKTLDKLMKSAMVQLREHSLSRERWLEEAQICENNGSLLTCQAIVKATIGLGVEEEDRMDTWELDAEQCIQGKFYSTARAIFAHALMTFTDEPSLWQQAAGLERQHGTPESHDEVLATAVRYCPYEPVLWMMRAKEKWQAGDVDSARDILSRGFQANPDSEQIWLAAVKVESEGGEYERARQLLAKAREESDTERVWMKSAVLERRIKNYDQCLVLVKEGLEKYPIFDKLWMIKGQVEDEALGQREKARETYIKGVKRCPSSVTLWILLAQLEERMGLVTKARSTLEKARYANPKHEQKDALWLQAIRLEIRDQAASASSGVLSDNNTAKTMIAKALHESECPKSGAIWREAIFLETRPQRKARGVDALKKCEGDPIVVTTVARLFWTERKIEKARTWFEKAVNCDPDHGDSYVWWYKFEEEHGLEEQKSKVVKMCVANEPRHGELWQSVAKQVDNTGKKTNEILVLCAAQAQ